MTNPRSAAADDALVELLEVSPQVDLAVVAQRSDAALLASRPETNGRTAARFAETATRMLDAAETARAELGRDPVVQVEVATPDGHVFLVAGETHVIAAVTSADPTVGLVFYDLKTALRTIREHESAASNGSGPSPVVVRSSDAETADSADASTDHDAPKQGRWSRRKQR